MYIHYQLMSNPPTEIEKVYWYKGKKSNIMRSLEAGHAIDSDLGRVTRLNVRIIR